MGRLNRKRNWPGRHVESPSGAVEPRKKVSPEVSAVFPSERKTEDDLRSNRTMCRNRCGEKDSGRMYHDRTVRRRAAGSQAALRNGHRRTGISAGAAEDGRHCPLGDGVDRLVLETRLQRAGRQREGLPGHPPEVKNRRGIRPTITMAGGWRICCDTP